MRIGTFDLDQFYPETMFQTATAATLLTVPTLATGSFAAGAGALGLAWVARQAMTAWKRDNCLLGSDLDVMDTREHAAATSEITDVLASYGLLNARLYQSLNGHVLTRHLVAVPAGTKLSKLPDDDIARDLGVKSVTIGANAGKGLISIDVPKQTRETVEFETLFQSPEWANRTGALPCIAGVDVIGNPVIFDLQSTPHLIVAGTTGSGKSVWVNAVILSLMQSGADFRLMIGDGKGEDFAPFYGDSTRLIVAADITNQKDGIEVVTPAGRAIATEVEDIKAQIEWLAAEMDNRFRTGSKPYPILFAIDELADIVMQDKDGGIVKTLSRIAQKGRSAKIHMVLATQYPSADVLPPLLRVNIPSRAGLTVAKDYESKVVLGETGCEKLLSKGDCLLKMVGGNPQRVHGAKIETSDMQRFMI